MNWKSNLKTVTLILFLILILINIPCVHAIDWSPDIRITWDASDDWYPSIMQANDGKIWVVWHSYRTGDYEIFYKVYDPSKVNPWSSDMRLTYSSYDIEPSIMQALDNRIWVIWTAQRTANFEIYYKIYNGVSWSPDTRLPADPESIIQYPSILQATNGSIWVFWTSMRTGNKEIFYKISHDNGASWSPDTILTAISSTAEDRDPAVTQTADGKIWLTWTKNDDIYYTIYNGVSWSSGNPVTTGSGFDWHSSVAQDASGKIWVVWSTDRTSLLRDIYYNIYDGGWLGDTELTTDTEGDSMPSITRATDGTMWVAWTSFRFNNRDIYYRTNSISPPHDVSIFNVTPSTNVVAQGKTVNIEVVAQNHGTNTETFSTNLYANTIFIGSHQIVDLSPGQLYPMTFNWNTTGVALGTYSIVANATIVVGETDTADNTYIDGTVAVAIRDVAVISVTPSSTIAYQNYYRTIFLEIKNEGTIDENVTVTAYYNSTEMGIATVPIEAGSTQTLLFFLDATDVPYGYYVISANASPLPDEADQTDNFLVDGTITLTIPGDVNGDRIVNMIDWSQLSAHWYPGPPQGPLGYGLCFDVNEDGAVNIVEISIASAHWGQFW